MKKIFALIGSRQKKGNTITFVKKITEKLNKDKYEIEYGFPQDYNIKPCIGCNTCFTNCKCVSNDELEVLQMKILSADLFIIASPVYMHYFTGDLKIIFDKLSWWTHTLRLQGKPVIILSTCCTNGHMTVIKPLGELLSYMGGNVIATANAAQLPNQINNNKWLEEVSTEIVNRIEANIDLPPQSNKDIEKIFKNQKYIVSLQKEMYKDAGIEPAEYGYWVKTGMINFGTFEEYLRVVSGGSEVNESSFSTTM